MLEELKEIVFRANLRLVEEGLVIQTFGNASGIDRKRGLVVIKPSGVDYECLGPEQMAVVSLETGKMIEGGLRPSSDTPTHLELYRAFPELGGIVHTHSLYATAWAQAKKEIPCFGTTQADYFYGAVPCTRDLTGEEIGGDYELQTGKAIVECFTRLSPLQYPGVIVACHGPFAWGSDPHEAVRSAAILEYIARLATETIRIAPETRPISQVLLDKHFLRKHGPQKYYGQVVEVKKGGKERLG